MGLLNEASGWLAGMMQAAATDEENETIIYTRKTTLAQIVLTGLAWATNTAFRRLPNEGGAAVVHGDRDYMIPVADLAIGDVPFEPERGDQIAHTKDGETLVFEVAALPGEPAFRPSDHEREIWRVHCKDVRTE